MKDDILKNIRKTNLISSIWLFILALMPTIGFFYFLIYEGFESWFMIMFLGFLSGVLLWLFGTSFQLVIEPRDSNIFKKYGGIENLERIIDEITNTKEYEDDRLIVAKNYVADKKDYEKILAYKDILRVHKLVHKTNFVIDRYDLVITDKYNFQISYSYAVKDEEKVDNLILLIGSKCENAKLGYTKEAEDHIKKNKEELPKDINTESNKEINKESYACPDCRKLIEEGDKFCKNCGCKIDWT